MTGALVFPSSAGPEVLFSEVFESANEPVKLMTRCSELNVAKQTACVISVKTQTCKC